MKVNANLLINRFVAAVIAVGLAYVTSAAINTAVTPHVVAATSVALSTAQGSAI